MMSKRKAGAGVMILGGLLFACPSAWAGFFVEAAPKGQPQQQVGAQAKAPVEEQARRNVEPAKANTCEFSIQQGDETVENALKRWAMIAGWQPPQWNYRTVYADYQSDFCTDGGFEGAVDLLMAAENAAGIPLFATFHSNRVVVIEGGK